MTLASASLAASPPKPPFGLWLIDQDKRTGAIGELARHARADRSFPRSGDSKAVWKHLNMIQVEGDLYDAMEEAELDYWAL